MTDKKVQKRLRRAVGTSLKLGRLAMLKHRLFKGQHFTKRNIDNWLSRSDLKKVQVGGGRHTLEGWMNLDIVAGDVFHDASKALPFPDNSVDLIFTEQFFEHLSYEDGSNFLAEAFRILKPGGVIRQSTPSLEFLCQSYTGVGAVPWADILKRHFTNHTSESPRTKSGFFNDMFRLWGHKYIYDRETLETASKDLGFVNFQIHPFGVSPTPELCNLERHADTEWMKTDFSIIYEAEKPQ